MKELKLIFVLVGALILAVGTIITAFTFGNWFDNLHDCLDNDPDKVNCLENFVREAPPVNDAEDFAQKCEESELECIKEIGKEAITQKIEDEVSK